MKLLKDIYVKYNTFILYAIYGIPPTIITFVIYSFLTYYMNFLAFISNGIAFFVGVFIGFFLYRTFVFKVKNNSKNRIVIQFLKYLSLRITSGFLETIIILITVDILGFNFLIFKVLASLSGALLNYFISKIFIFTRKTK